MMEDWTGAPVLQVSSALIVTPNNLLAGLQKSPEGIFGGLAACHSSRTAGFRGATQVSGIQVSQAIT